LDTSALPLGTIGHLRTCFALVYGLHDLRRLVGKRLQSLPKTDLGRPRIDALAVAVDGQRAPIATGKPRCVLLAAPECLRDLLPPIQRFLIRRTQDVRVGQLHRHAKPSAKSSHVRGKRSLTSLATASAYCRISHCAAVSNRSARNPSQLRRFALARIRE